MKTKTIVYEDYDQETLLEAAAYLNHRTNNIQPRKTTIQKTFSDYDDELRQSYLSKEELVLLSILKAKG